MVVNQAFTTVTWNASDLLHVHCMATSATVGYGFARAVKLKYVELWEPNQGTGQFTSLAGIIFYGTGATNTGTNDERFAVSVGSNDPAHLLAYPPAGTLLGAWQNYQSSLVLFDLKNMEVGTIVDISFDWLSGENQNTTNTTFSITGGTLGVCGVHLPSTSLTAVGLNNF